MKHTQTPWMTFRGSYNLKGRLRTIWRCLKNESAILVCRGNAHLLDNPKDREIVCIVSYVSAENDTDKANATRIIECVNACEGMENPAEEIERLRFLLDAKEQSYDEAVDIIADLERRLKKAQKK